MAYPSLSDGKMMISEHRTQLPNGQTIVHEVLKTGDDDIVTANILVGADGKALTSTYCGTCGGVSVGCVDCPNNDPVLDCVTAQFTALPKRTEGGGFVRRVLRRFSGWVGCSHWEVANDRADGAPPTGCERSSADCVGHKGVDVLNGK